VDDGDDVLNYAECNAAVLKVGDKVKNCAGLRGTIEKAHGDGTYAVRYNDGREDLKLPASLITALPAGMLLFICLLYLCHCLYYYEYVSP
jgi:hypothetical protein